MEKNTDQNKHLFSNFSTDDKEQIDRALAIVERIPDDPHYHRPKGIEVAAILRRLQRRLENHARGNIERSPSCPS